MANGDSGVVSLPADLESAAEFLGIRGFPEIGMPLSMVRAAESVEPTQIAHFAASVVLGRVRGRLTMIGRDGDIRLRKQDAPHALWIAWGTLAISADGVLVVSSLGIGSWPEARERETSQNPYRGVNSEVLRAISPAWIASEASAFLRITASHSDEIERARGKPFRPQAQRDKAGVIAKATVAPAVVEGHDLERIARRYAYLVRSGIRRGVHRSLATEFGISEGASRTRVARARAAGYLAGTKQGRVGALPGPNTR